MQTLSSLLELQESIKSDPVVVYKTLIQWISTNPPEFQKLKSVVFDLLLHLFKAWPNLLSKLAEDYLNSVIPQPILLMLLQNESLSLDILNHLHSRMVLVTFHNIHPLYGEPCSNLKAMISLISTASQTQICESLVISFKKLLSDYMDAVLESKTKEFYPVSTARHVLLYFISLYTVPSLFISNVTPYLIKFLQTKIDLTTIIEMEQMNGFSLCKVSATTEHQPIVVKDLSLLRHIIPCFEPFVGLLMEFILGNFQNFKLLNEIMDLVLDYLQDLTLADSLNWMKSVKESCRSLLKLWYKNPRPCTRILILYSSRLSSLEELVQFYNDLEELCPDSMSPKEYSELAPHICLLLDATSCHGVALTLNQPFSREFFDLRFNSLINQKHRNTQINPLFVAMASHSKSVDFKFKKWEIWFSLFHSLNLKNEELVLVFLIKHVPRNAYTPMGSLYTLIQTCIQKGSQNMKARALYIDLILLIGSLYSMNQGILDIILDKCRYIKDLDFCRELIRDLPEKETWIPTLMSRYSILFPTNLDKIKRNHLESQVLLIYQEIPIIWDLFELASMDANAKGDQQSLKLLLKHLQLHVFLFKEWWSMSSRKNSLVKEFPYHYQATCALVRIYSELRKVSEPCNSIQILLPFLNGYQTFVILGNFCHLVEAHYGVAEIGLIQERQSKFYLVLQDMIRKMVLNGTLDPEISDFFLIGLN